MWKLLAVFIAAALPISEVRGAIPLGVALGLSPAATFITAVVGNMLPVPPLLALLGFAESFLVKRLNAEGGGLLSKAASAYFKLAWSARRRVRPYVNRYGALGLALFTAIPLPFTGAWTSSLAAHVLGMDRRVATLSIWLGVVAAALIVSSLVGLVVFVLPGF